MIIMNFSLLILSQPSDKATERIRVWRAIKALGAAALRDGAYLLPDRDDVRAALAAQAEAVRASGGTAWLLTVAEDEDAFHGLFDRAAEFAELAQEAEAARHEGLEADALLRRARQLRRRFEALAAIDYFPGDAQPAAGAAVEALMAEARRRKSPDEPGFVEASIPRLDPAAYQGRLWATRCGLWVDRLASAWLIRRHIDPAARFLWLAQPADCPADALGFDFDGAVFTHVGARVTFETLLAAFGLEPDPALMHLGRMVHTLDVGGGASPEAAGFSLLLRGLKARIDDDHTLLAEGGRLLDDLYIALQQGETA
ncbi:MAG: chromate resistance protein [Betaproteobacteria bacterium]|nr:chromate resistance protein [Betaproteobacteria bacterium]